MVSPTFSDTQVVTSWTRTVVSASATRSWVSSLHMQGIRRMDLFSSLWPLASQRLSQSRGLWSGLSFLRLQIRDRSKAPLCLATRTEKSAFGSSFRGQQKGKARLLKTLVHPRAQALKLLEEGQLGIVMF